MVRQITTLCAALALLAPASWAQDGEGAPMEEGASESTADAAAPAPEPAGDDDLPEAELPEEESTVAPPPADEPEPEPEPEPESAAAPAPAPTSTEPPMGRSATRDAANDGEAPAAQGTKRETVYAEVRRGEPAGALPVTSKVLPVYPIQLQTMYGEQAIRCTAKVWVGENGKAKRVAVTDCPDGFHVAALEAIQKWSWERPSGRVPEEGVVTEVITGFARPTKRMYFPGITYFRSPEEITSDPELLLLLKGGKLPKYPPAVNSGDDICLVELTVDARGNTVEALIDECAPPYRKELSKVVKTWKWWWTRDPGKKETTRLVTEIVFRL
ncbi:MAG: hypothetical protein H6732_05330 [Alphaproteobacteria bacterium]|nr:hypothetical protein [Alphaproteobacteria bacterium]